MKRIKEERQKLGLLQKEVAEFISMDRTTYAKYETGSIMPPVDVLVRLSDFFNVTVDYLIGRDRTEDETIIKSDSKEIIKLYESLNADGKDTAMKTIRALAAYPELSNSSNENDGMKKA